MVSHVFPFFVQVNTSTTTNAVLGVAGWSGSSTPLASTFTVLYEVIGW